MRAVAGVRGGVAMGVGGDLSGGLRFGAAHTHTHISRALPFLLLCDGEGGNPPNAFPT